MTVTKQYVFGSGTVTGTRNDIDNQTPYTLGALQDISVDFSYDEKELYGQDQFPIAIARGKGKVTGKAKIAQFNAQAYNDLFFAQTGLSSGQTLYANLETGSIPATPFEITVTHAVNYVEDMGVIDATTGQSLTKVASGPTTGQYSVDATTGIYTFAAADTLKGVYLSYTYSATTGKKFTVTNQLMGTGPTFSLTLTQVFDGNVMTIKLYRCVSSKLGFAFKNDDFNMSDFDFSAVADASGKVFDFSSSQ